MRHLPVVFLVLTGCVVGANSSDPPEREPDSRDDVEDIELLPPGKAAIILAHGLGGDGTSFDPAIVAAIEADGHAVLRTEVPGVESVAIRAAALAPQIDAMLTATGATQVHIIAHSMGGLDARHAISTLGYAPKVASLATISSPHQGSPLADVALENDSDALDALVELVGQVDPEALNRALIDLSEAQAPAFNAATPDAAGVRYLSYAGFSTPNAIDNPNADAACGAVATPDEMLPLLVLPATIVAQGLERRPNDGVVGVASSKWTGFEGCIPADHLDETTREDMPAFYKALVVKLVP